MVGAPAKNKNSLSLKRHLFPHGDRVKMLAQGFLDLFFDAAPHLEYFIQFFELSTKAAFAKAAFDTLRWEFSLRRWDRNSNTVKTQKFHSSGVCLREPEKRLIRLPPVRLMLHPFSIFLN